MLAGQIQEQISSFIPIALAKDLPARSIRSGLAIAPTLPTQHKK
jgi:hypothetical protein